MSLDQKTYFENFLYLCDLFGTCIGRTQGAGGNISVKWGNTLVVKASGYRLSTVSEKDGYVYCDIDKVKTCYNNNKENLESSILENNHLKPSMETFFHLLPKVYVVHIHPVFFCKYLCKPNANTIFSQENFQGSLFISYEKPGLALAKSIISKYNNETVIFLENHGLILLGDSIEEIVNLYNDNLKKLEQLSNESSNYSCILIEKRIKDITKQTVKPIYGLPYDLPKTFNPITPDHYLFLEESCLKTLDSNLECALSEWKENRTKIPSILQVGSQVYILGKSFQQCQNKEEYLQTYFEIYTGARSLANESIQELSSCSKEIFRLNLR